MTDRGQPIGDLEARIASRGCECQFEGIDEGGIVEDGAVAIDGGKVVAVDRREALERRFPDAETLGSPGDVVLPGLVNSHSHGWGLTTLQLGVDDDYLEAFNLNLLAATPQDVYAETLYSCAKLIRSGVTSVWHAGFSRDWSAG